MVGIRYIGFRYRLSRGLSCSAAITQSFVFFAGLAGPAIHAVEREPDSVDVDYGKGEDAEPDPDAGSAEIVRDDSRYCEGDDNL